MRPGAESAGQEISDQLYHLSFLQSTLLISFPYYYKLPMTLSLVRSSIFRFCELLRRFPSPAFSVASRLCVCVCVVDGIISAGRWRVAASRPGRAQSGRVRSVRRGRHTAHRHRSVRHHRLHSRLRRRVHRTPHSPSRREFSDHTNLYFQSP